MFDYDFEFFTLDTWSISEIRVYFMYETIHMNIS